MSSSASCGNPVNMPSWNFVTDENPASTITFQRRTPISKLYNVVDGVTEWIESVKSTEVRHVGLEVEIDTRIGTLQLYRTSLKTGGNALAVHTGFIGTHIREKVRTLRKQFPFETRDMCEHMPELEDEKKRLLGTIALPSSSLFPNLKLPLVASSINLDAPCYVM